MCATDGIPEVGVDMSSLYICRRGLITKTFASTNASHNICKKCVLRSKLDSAKLDYRSDIRATDGIP